MTEKELMDIILTLPTIRSIEMPDDQKRDSIGALLPIVLDEITMAYDWDFTLGITSTSSVVDQADYVLYGADNDNRDIINVKYNGELIIKMGQVEHDKFMVGRTNSTTRYWIPKGRENGFPRITLASAPSAVNTIEYRYRLKNLTFADFPNEFDFVVMSGIVKHMNPTYFRIYEKDLSMMIDRHESSGGESDQAEQDWLIIKANNRRSTLMGYGGGR